MDFRPQAGEKITIDQPFVFMPHPAAPDFPYGQSGRRGTVYQVKLDGAAGAASHGRNEVPLTPAELRSVDAAGEEHPYHALKVFSEFFQDQRNSDTAQRLISCAGMPGLEACYRKVILPSRYPNLVQRYPQLSYAVLMPWVDGETWFDIIFGCQALTPTQSYGLAREMVHCLVELEKRKMAHCDLSGANILVQPETLKVSMVDVEEMYIPGLPAPDEKKLPAGTPGYGHKTASRGLWCPEADRFAGAVLLGEILGWCSEKVRQNACEAQFFDIEEVQTVCPRYRILNDALRRQWGSPISDLFSRAWFSEKLSDCPTFERWQAALFAAAPAGETAPVPREEIQLSAAPQLIPAEASAAAESTSPPPAQAELAQVYRPADPWASIDAPATGSVPRRRSLPVRLRVHLPARLLIPLPARLPVSRRTLGAALILLLLLGLGGGGAAWLLTPHGSTTLQGQVQDAQSGQPLAARVELKGSGWPVSLTAGPKGEFRFEHLPGMSAEMIASYAGYQPTTIPIQVPETGALTLQPIKLTLTGASIYGKAIVAEPAAGLEGAKVTLAGTYLTSGKSFTETRTTGADGYYEFALADGFNAKLTFEKNGYPLTSFQTTLHVLAGQQRDLYETTIIKTK